MTDLEMTRLCAKAMDLLRETCQFGKVHPVRMGSSLAPIHHYEYPRKNEGRRKSDCIQYSPLHDDVQAMALMKKLKLQVDWSAFPFIWVNGEANGSRVYANSKDLNRAIAECAAKIQQAKETS